MSKASGLDTATLRLGKIEAKKLVDSLLLWTACIQGPVYKWKMANWCNHKVPVPNADLWVQLVTLLDLCHAQVQWIWVPSHVDVPGNEKADELAAAGRNRSPLVTTPAPATPEPPLPRGTRTTVLICRGNCHSPAMQWASRTSLVSPR